MNTIRTAAVALTLACACTMSGWAKDVDQQKDKYNTKNNKNGCIDDYFHMNHYNSCF